MIKDFLGRDVVFSDDESIFTVAEILQLAAVEAICLFLSERSWESMTKKIETALKTYSSEELESLLLEADREGDMQLLSMIEDEQIDREEETPDENCETCYGNKAWCPDCSPEAWNEVKSDEI